MNIINTFHLPNNCFKQPFKPDGKLFKSLTVRLLKWYFFTKQSAEVLLSMEFLYSIENNSIL